MDERIETAHSASGLNQRRQVGTRGWSGKHTYVGKEDVEPAVFVNSTSTHGFHRVFVSDVCGNRSNLLTDPTVLAHRIDVRMS